LILAIGIVVAIREIPEHPRVVQDVVDAPVGESAKLFLASLTILGWLGRLGWLSWWYACHGHLLVTI
jgi:hypothetical protein